jgi:hypothetical protein
MLGGQQHRGPAAGAFDEIASGGSRTPGGGSGGGELSREAGLDDIGRGGSGRAGLFDASDQDAGHDRTAGLLDTDADDSDDTEFDDDTDDGSDDTDVA